MESNICIIPDVPKEHFPLKEWKRNHLCIYRYSNSPFVYVNICSTICGESTAQTTAKSVCIPTNAYVYSNTFPAIWPNHYAHLLLRTQGKFSENPNGICMGIILVVMQFTQREIKLRNYYIDSDYCNTPAYRKSILSAKKKIPSRGIFSR